MEDNRNRNYDDFFKSSDQHKDQDYDKREDQVDRINHNSEQSYYYSYGPFSSQSAVRRVDDHQTDGSSNREATNTYDDVSAPDSEQLVRVYEAARQSSAQERSWQYQPPRRRGGWIGSFFAAFLACALIMTGLVYAADVNNWFTGGQANAAGASSGQSTATIGKTASYSNGSSSSTAASNVVLPGSIADIVEQSSPAVVLIETYVNARQRSTRNNMDFFEYFFGDRIQVTPDNGDNMINSGLGTGFIFDKDGYILTNEHVVSGADEIYVTVEGYTEPFKAELLGSDYDLDLAVLKITGEKEFVTLPIGDSTQLRVGEWVTAIGNPLGYDHTVSVGVVSAKGREITIPESSGTRYYTDLLQTDASINSGNSGGPLLNMNGEVVGINTAVSSNAQGIGFAIPSSTFVSVIDQLKNNQSIPKPYIGVGISDIDEAWLEDLKLSSTEGALVTQVVSGGPAARAGIQTWDVITKINDKKVTNADDVKKYIQELNVGDRATVTVIRDGKEIQFGVIIADRNNS